MSTNDAVFLLANGRSGAPLLDESHPDWPAFEAALSSLCVDLARAIAEDGEGATKLVEVKRQRRAGRRVRRATSRGAWRGRTS